MLDKTSRTVLQFNQKTGSNKAYALLIGINYDGQPSELKGCINDAQNMSSVFVSKGIPHNLMLNPTKKTILRELNNALQSSWDNQLDHFVLYYSGHGTFVKDNNSDEADRRDECMLPCDFQESGYILDDELNGLLGRFNPKTRIIGIFDCCHAGTLLDLKYRWKSNLMRSVENPTNTVNKIVSLSACQDSQVSKEFQSPDGFAGVFTYHLIPMLLKDHKTFGIAKSINDKMRGSGFQQECVVCSSYDIRGEFSLLPNGSKFRKSKK